MQCCYSYLCDATPLNELHSWGKREMGKGECKDRTQVLKYPRRWFSTDTCKATEPHFRRLEEWGGGGVGVMTVYVGVAPRILLFIGYTTSI